MPLPTRRPDRSYVRDRCVADDDDRPVDALINTIRTLSIDASEGGSATPAAARLPPLAYVRGSAPLPRSARAAPVRSRSFRALGRTRLDAAVLLHLTGYDVSPDDLKQFRQWDSKTPGHPEWHLRRASRRRSAARRARGAVGMASRRSPRATSIDPADHRSPRSRWSGCDTMEGVACEAGAGRPPWALSRVLHRREPRHADGPLPLVSEMFMRATPRTVHVQYVENGDHDSPRSTAAIAPRAPDWPASRRRRTTIRHGSPEAARARPHGSPRPAEAEARGYQASAGWIRSSLRADRSAPHGAMRSSVARRRTPRARAVHRTRPPHPGPRSCSSRDRAGCRLGSAPPSPAA